MYRFAGALLVAAFLSGCSTPASLKDDTQSQRVSVEVTDDQKERLAFVQKQGAEIYRRDQAAWVSTDALMAGLDAAPEEVGLAGWVTEPVTGEQNAYNVTYVSNQSDALTALAKFKTVNGVVVSSDIRKAVSERAALTEAQLSAYQARQTAASIAPSLALCGGRYNTVTLPTVSGYDVYLLAPETENGQVQFGGHFRVPIDSDGAVGEVEAFSNSCISLTRSPPDASAASVALFITHLKDDIPSEIHVFKSMSFGLPVFVGTTTSSGETAMWNVAGDKITRAN